MKQQTTSSLLSLSLILLLTFLAACKKDKKPSDSKESSNYSSIDSTYGFGILGKLEGIWDGPVTSSTPLGGFPEWIVDFRPISENQISSKNELDTLNSIFMSFFIAKYNNEYRVCFRNGGSFNGLTRVSYFLADSVSETATQSYYRFSEIIKGESRAYTEVVFRNDSLWMKTYTNHYNTLSTPTLHMTWNAKLQDLTSAQAAVSHFAFPKKTLTKDFSNSFTGQPESVFYSTSGGDPYPETDQPYLGQATISYTYLNTYAPVAAKKVFLVITTQPLISGFTPNLANLKYRSRYVILAANNNTFVFSSMHPGTYYLYAFYDADNNLTFSSGDWVSTANTTFTLPEHGTVSASTQINFTIP